MAANAANTSAEEKRKSPLGIILTLFILLGLLVVLGVLDNAQKAKKNETGSTETAAAQIEDASGSDNTETAETDITDTQETTKTTQISDGTTEAAIASASGDATFDLEKASTPRILGNPNAPVKISEHSSFTCGACSVFHKDNFKQIKRDFIDTDKAYIVFDDFPRNAYDVKVGAVARCVPEEAYFNYVQLLFETQKDWLNDDYLSYLRQNALLTGASAEQIDNCLNSTELHETLAERQDLAHKTHGVKATPTLVINDNVVISGLDTYENIKNAIEGELEKKAQ